MLNTSQVRGVIKRVLKSMNVYSPEYELLILGTFIYESELSNLHSPGRNIDSTYKFGLMGLSQKKLVWLLEDYIPYNNNLEHKIAESCGFHISDLKPCQLRHMADEHIGFMIALTYAWYFGHIDRELEMDYIDIAKCYRDVWDGGYDSTCNIDLFVDKLKNNL